MTDGSIELARQSRLKTLAMLGGYTALAVLLAWIGKTWDYVPGRLLGTGFEGAYLASRKVFWLGIAVLTGGAGWWKFGLAALRATLGGPALYVSGGRLTYLFRSVRSWPLSSVAAVRLQTVPYSGPFLRIEMANRRPLLLNMALFRERRQEVLDRCVAAGLPVAEGMSTTQARR